MTDVVATALIIAVPTTIASIASAVATIKKATTIDHKLDAVQTAVNGNLSTVKEQLAKALAEIERLHAVIDKGVP